MAFKPNYNQQRAERDRLKKAKKEEKLKRRQEAQAERGGADEEAPAVEDQDEAPA
jgi:hypothetical protein